MSDQSSSDVAVRQIAEEVARQIVARSGGGDGEAPVVTVGAGTITGSFTLGIVFNGTTYTLQVTVPADPATTPYVFSLTDAAKPNDPIVSFKYKDTSNWKVDVALPTPIGPLHQLVVHLGDGDPGPPKPPPAS